MAGAGVSSPAPAILSPLPHFCQTAYLQSYFVMDSDGLAEESIKKEQNKSLTPPARLLGIF
ncbi:MAG: hypothetical protein DWI07_01910 [Planctomycetota bacterium]|nr:MAG: hypothetical protein DWI07_01910 [Planctomycetota bacterium]